MLSYTAFDPSHLRAFSYVVPNLADDMHDGATRTAEIQTGDKWLSVNVPPMLAAGAEVILTWDEGSKSDEHVATIAIGGTAAAGATDWHAYTHPGPARRPRGRLGAAAPERGPDGHPAADPLARPCAAGGRAAARHLAVAPDVSWDSDGRAGRANWQLRWMSIERRRLGAALRHLAVARDVN